MKKFLIMKMAVFSVLALAVMAYADEATTGKGKPWAKGAITLGSFLSGTNSEVRIGAPGIGVSIDAEEVFGLDSTTTVFRTDGMWRFTDNLRHRLDATWFSIHRNGAAKLGRDITIGSTVLPTGSDVTTSLNLDIYKLAYSYSFFQDDRMDLALGAGVFICPISFELNATGAINNHTSEGVTAPLPVVGLRADFAITPKWMLKNNLDVFYMELGNFKGSLVDFKSAVEYNWFKHFGVGLGIESFNLHVEAEGNDYPSVNLLGAFTFKYMGAMLYGKLYF
ncbi:MAG: hypothetical protein ABIL58_18340 [Pseudomonadota bacterium]